MLISQLCPKLSAVLEIRGCETPPEAVPEPPSRRLKGSSQLNRWSRARAIRSGRKLDRPSPPVQTLPHNPPISLSPDPDADEIDGVEGVEVRVVKSIYIVSDGTGWTAEHCVNAALGQFDYCLVDHGCPVNTHLFSAVTCRFHFSFILSFFIILINPIPRRSFIIIICTWDMICGAFLIR